MSKSAPDMNSRKSIISSSLSGGSTLTSWPKKVGAYISRKPNNSYLTEASLQEFNRRNALTEARTPTSSPYYTGLTDFSLVINRERLSGQSPGRESRSPSSVSSGSKSFVAVKVQERSSSWFTLKKRDNNFNATHNRMSFFRARSSYDTRSKNSSSPQLSCTGKAGVTTTITKPEADLENLEVRAPPLPGRDHQIKSKPTKSGSESERKKVTFPSVIGEDTVNVSTEEKQLRKKESEPQYSTMPIFPPTRPPPDDVHLLAQTTQPMAQAELSLPPTSLPCAETPPPTRPAAESFPSLPSRPPAKYEKMMRKY